MDRLSRHLASSRLIEATTQACPRCGRQLAIHFGYVTWCECGWNLVAPARPEAASGRVGRLYSRIGRRLADSMTEELISADRLEPRLTPSRLTAYVIAAIVYATAFLLFAASIAILVFGFPNVFAFLFAFVFFSLAFFMRPRLGKPPKEDVLGRGEAPTLYALADEISDALETSRVDLITLDHEFNASWAVLGLRRRRVLRLGLPMLAMLGPQERVALTAHELAHGRNGDSARGLFVGSAVRALEELYAIFAPDPHLSESIAEGELGLFDRITNVFFWIVSRPILGLLYLELHLLLRDSQRAEYLADALAAEAAGTGAVIGLHEKLFLEPAFHAVVQHASRQREEGQMDVFAEVARLSANVPDRERERRRRIARLEEARLDDTHPPTARRIELLERRSPRPPRVTLGPERSASVDDELASQRPALQRILVEEYQDSLYYG